MNTGKPVFQEFVEANQGLLDCYNAVGPEQFKKLSEAQREGTCSSYRDKIRSILSANQLVMSNLVRERVVILKKLGAEQEIKIRQ